MATKFPSVTGKIVLVVVVAVAMFGLLSPSADAGEAAAVAVSPQQDNPQCNLLVKVSPDCDTWCTEQDHPGGYVKSDVCCCNSSGLAADSYIAT